MMGIKQLHIINRVHFESPFSCEVSSYKTFQASDTYELSQIFHSSTQSHTCHSHSTSSPLNNQVHIQPQFPPPHRVLSQRALVHGSDPLAVALYRLQQPLQFRVVLRCTFISRHQRNAPLSGIVCNSWIFDDELICQELRVLHPVIHWLLKPAARVDTLELEHEPGPLIF